MRSICSVSYTHLDVYKRQENNLDYFGIGGTGIGALRHKGFIPWDDDIDIGLPRKDYEKFIEIAKKELSEKYIVLTAEDYENWPFMMMRLIKKGTKFREYCLKDVDCELGIFLDLYAFDNISDDPKKLKRQGMAVWFLSLIHISMTAFLIASVE